MINIELSFLRKASLLYPMPIAIACGRVLRARGDAEKLEAIIKAAEVLARYLAAVSLASFAARPADDTASISPLEKHLAFGHFLALIKQIAGLNVDHPLASQLKNGFRSKKKAEPSTEAALDALIKLRNDLAHHMTNLSEPSAAVILTQQNPEKLLEAALKGVEPILSMPLFVIEEQRSARRIFYARRLLLMGESADPAPEELELSRDIYDTGVPYLAVDDRVLPLPPLLIWELVEERSNYRLLFLDAVLDDSVKYRTIEANEKRGGKDVVEALLSLCAGKRREQERVTLLNGQHLAREWSERKRRTEEAEQQREGRVPWNELDEETLRWFAAKLKNTTSPEPNKAISEKLLEGRTQFSADELRQLTLLFGKPSAIKETLRRDVIDLKLRHNPNERWDERVLIESDNLLQALRKAVAFFAKNITGANEITAEGLDNKNGTADYLAIREALVNQFIHQDYKDPSAPAQIDMQPDTTTLFNTGFSLVEQDTLLNGGKSQSRNPIIAKALRLIGFAELAGSGIRALQQAWKTAQRRSPQFSSDRQANTFTVTLDWRPAPPIAYDAHWKSKIGASLTAPQAQILNASAIEEGITLAQAASVANISEEEALKALEHLLHQMLIEPKEACYHIKTHLKAHAI